MRLGSARRNILSPPTQRTTRCGSRPKISKAGQRDPRRGPSSPRWFVSCSCTAAGGWRGRHRSIVSGPRVPRREIRHDGNASPFRRTSLRPDVLPLPALRGPCAARVVGPVPYRLRPSGSETVRQLSNSRCFRQSCDYRLLIDFDRCHCFFRKSEPLQTSVCVLQLQRYLCRQLRNEPIFIKTNFSRYLVGALCFVSEDQPMAVGW